MGVEFKRITLWVLGGVAEFPELPTTMSIITKTDLLRLLHLAAAHLLPHPRPMPVDALRIS